MLKNIVYKLGAVLVRAFFNEKCATITVASFSFFVRLQSSPCMYHLLVQTLIG